VTLLLFPFLVQVALEYTFDLILDREKKLFLATPSKDLPEILSLTDYVFNSCVALS